MQRLLLLDGMRGIAALAVVAFHMPRSGPSFFAEAWLAVDFFFLLSGFVMARAYGSRFDTMGFREFMRVRLRRLYPAILVGLALAAALHLMLAPRDELLWVKIVLAAAMLPFPLGYMFPLNGVQWSLMFELIANALHAALPAKAMDVAAPVFAGVGAACLLIAFLSGTTINAGNTLSTLWMGAARVLFSFFAGVTLFGLYQRGALQRWLQLSAFTVLALFVLVLALPTLNAEAPRDLITTLVMWPLVLALALRVPEPTGWLAASCRRLGWLSYPLYATHMPINEAMQPLMRSWGWPGTALCWVVVLAVAYAAARATEPTPRSSARLLHDQVSPRNTLLPIRK